jgi:hypothetical protein
VNYRTMNTDRPAQTRSDTLDGSLTEERELVEAVQSKRRSPSSLSNRDNVQYASGKLGHLTKSPQLFSENNSFVVVESKFSSNVVDKNFYNKLMREGVDILSEDKKNLSREFTDPKIELLERVFTISRREIRFVKKACFKKWFKKVTKQREMIVKGIRLCESLMYVFKVYTKSHFFQLKQNIKSKHFSNIKRASLLKMLLMNKLHYIENYKRIYFTKFRALCSITDRDCSRAGTPIKLNAKTSRSEPLRLAGLLIGNTISNLRRDQKRYVLHNFHLHTMVKKDRARRTVPQRAKALKNLVSRSIREVKKNALNKWVRLLLNSREIINQTNKNNEMQRSGRELLFVIKIQEILKKPLERRMDVAMKYLLVNMLNVRNREEGIKNLIIKTSNLIDMKLSYFSRAFITQLLEKCSIMKDREIYMLRVLELIQKREVRYAFGNLKRETEIVRIEDTVNKYTYFCIRNALQTLSKKMTVVVKSAFDQIVQSSRKIEIGSTDQAENSEILQANKQKQLQLAAYLVVSRMDKITLVQKNFCYQ